jgi:hypothetical protein
MSEISRGILAIVEVLNGGRIGRGEIWSYIYNRGVAKFPTVGALVSAFGSRSGVISDYHVDLEMWYCNCGACKGVRLVTRSPSRKRCSCHRILVQR